MATKRKIWTLEELHSLPDDGNRYELVRGALLVTPPPDPEHEVIAARLARLLEPFVAANDLGMVFRPRAVFRYRGSEAEPDLMVRQPPSTRTSDWRAVPKPILVAEILAPSTRRRDHEEKRRFYMDAGIDDYWIVDPEERTITIVRRGEPDRTESERVEWQPAVVQSTLVIRLGDLFVLP